MFRLFQVINSEQENECLFATEKTAEELSYSEALKKIEDAYAEAKLTDADDFNDKAEEILEAQGFFRMFTEPVFIKEL